jgi:hypothetical protein
MQLHDINTETYAACSLSTNLLYYHYRKKNIHIYQYDWQNIFLGRFTLCLMVYKMYIKTPLCNFTLPQGAFLKPKFLNTDPPEMLGGLKYKRDK